jgi:arabinogalactan oligomer/maltooligosaccharide transport system substrate-binding protein
MPAFGPHPSHPFANVEAFVVNRLSRHPNEELSLLQYMTTHTQLPEFKAQGDIPVLKKALDSQAVRQDPVARGLAQAAVSSDPVPNIREMNEVWEPMNRALALILSGGAAPDEAAHQAAASIRAAIAKAGG